VTATDPDSPANSLTFTLDSPPERRDDQSDDRFVHVDSK
jgi:hypothetical protein